MQITSQMLLSVAGEIEVLFAVQNVFYLDNQLTILNGAVQRCRVASALDLVDANRRKAPSAVSTDHVVPFLIVAFVGRPANIAGIKGGP